MNSPHDTTVALLVATNPIAPNIPKIFFIYIFSSRPVGLSILYKKKKKKQGAGAKTAKKFN
jgi:hypothetical protein